MELFALLILVGAPWLTWLLLDLRERREKEEGRYGLQLKKEDLVRPPLGGMQLMLRDATEEIAQDIDREILAELNAYERHTTLEKKAENPGKKLV